MISPATLPGSRALGSTSVRPPYKHATIMLATLALLVGFTLTQAPVASAAPAGAHSETTAQSDPPLPCRGEKPGVCPFSPFVQAPLQQLI